LTEIKRSHKQLHREIKLLKSKVNKLTSLLEQNQK
jgi:hypothetical protein